MTDSAQYIYDKKMAALKAGYLMHLKKTTEQLLLLRASMITEQDKREIIRIAHIISGSAGLFELNDLGELAGVAELEMEAMPIPDIKKSIALNNLINFCNDVTSNIDS